MKKKRLARVIIAAVVTAAILVAIIVGCGPKWGDGSANVNGSNSNSSKAHQIMSPATTTPRNPTTIMRPASP